MGPQSSQEWSLILGGGSNMKLGTLREAEKLVFDK